VKAINPRHGRVTLPSFALAQGHIKLDTATARWVAGQIPLQPKQFQLGDTQGPRARWRKVMNRSMQMVIVAGVLMLALLIAVIGSVGADSIAWHSAVANTPAAQQL
jgi:hypothetical protein